MTKDIGLTQIALAGGLMCLSLMAGCVTPTGVRNKSNVNNSTPANKPLPSPSATSSTAAQKDGVNDVADGDGRKPQTKLNGIDVTGVQLEMTDSSLRVTFEANDSIPASMPTGISALWQVKAWSKDKTQGYYLGAKLVGSEWHVFVFNLKTATNVYVENPSVNGKKLVVSFPLNQLPNLAPAFTWSATTEYDGKWRDEIPNEGKVSFPAA